jgi:O-antigen/teichoic acid export membrane protein
MCDAGKVSTSLADESVDEPGRAFKKEPAGSGGRWEKGSRFQETPQLDAGEERSVLHRTMRGGASFFLANMLKRGSGFIFVVIASRLLGPTGFGLLTLGLSVSQLVIRFALFGLTNTAQRFLAGDFSDEQRRMLQAVLAVGGASSVVFTVATFVITPWIAYTFFGEPRLLIPLRVLTLSIGLGSTFFVLRAVLQAQEALRSIIWSDAVLGAGKAVLVGVALLIFGYTPVTAAGGVVAAYAASVVVVARLLYARFDARWAWPQVSRRALVRVVRFSGPMIFVGLGYFVAEQADRLMLGIFGAPSDVGRYTVASTLTLMLVVLMASLGSIFMPIASSAYRKRDMGTIYTSYRFVGRLAGGVSTLALLTFVALGTSLLGIFGGEYAATETYHALLILCVLQVVANGLGPTDYFLQMTDSHRAEAVNAVLFVVLNVILNAVLIPAYGLVGAALATAVSGLLRNVLQVVEIVWWYDFWPFTLWDGMRLAFALGGGGVAWAFGPGTVGGGIAAAGWAVGFLGLTWWRTPDAERILLQRMVRRVWPTTKAR